MAWRALPARHINATGTFHAMQTQTSRRIIVNGSRPLERYGVRTIWRDFRAHSIRVFVFDVLSSELRRDGVRVTIGEQPTQVLRLLLERHGELVTREDLRATLWPGQTFIDDFDQGLNAAVKRLRDYWATRQRSATHRDRPAAGLQVHRAHR